MEQPRPAFFDLMSAMFIIDKNEIANFATRDAGSGPFRVESWTPGKSFLLERYKDFWGEAPKLDGIEVRVLPDLTTAGNELDAGGIDLLLNADQVTADRQDGTPNIKVEYQVNSPRIFYLMANVTRGRHWIIRWSARHSTMQLIAKRSRS